MTGLPRIGLDQGCPRSSATALQEKGWDVVHVDDIGMSRATDAEIVEWAAHEQPVVVTLDSDFHALAGNRARFLRIRHHRALRFKLADF